MRRIRPLTLGNDNQLVISVSVTALAFFAKRRVDKGDIVDFGYQFVASRRQERKGEAEDEGKYDDDSMEFHATAVYPFECHDYTHVYSRELHACQCNCRQSEMPCLIVLPTSARAIILRA